VFGISRHDRAEGQLADAIRYALSRWKGLTRFLDDARVQLDNCPVESSIRRSSSTEKMRSSQAPRRRLALRSHRFGDRNLQAERRRSARLSCDVDGHHVQLWEGTLQVALLSSSNLPFEQRRPLQLRARRPQAVCLGTINGRGDYLHVPGSPGTSSV
jgi:Transposase IS66 family